MTILYRVGTSPIGPPEMLSREVPDERVSWLLLAAEMRWARTQAEARQKFLDRLLAIKDAANNASLDADMAYYEAETWARRESEKEKA